MQVLHSPKQIIITFGLASDILDVESTTADMFFIGAQRERMMRGVWTLFAVAVATEAAVETKGSCIWCAPGRDNTRTSRALPQAPGVPSPHLAWSSAVGSLVYPSPLLWQAANGTTLVLSTGYNFSVHDAKGSTFWSHVVPWTNDGTYASVREDGDVWVGGARAGFLFGFSLSTGSTTWSQFPLTAATGVSMVTRDGLGIIPLYFGSITAHDASGNGAWGMSTSDSLLTLPAESSADGSLYLFVDSVLSCVNGSTRATIWSTTITNSTYSIAGPMLDGDVVYVATFWDLFAVNASTGDLVWTFTYNVNSLGYVAPQMALGQDGSVILEFLSEFHPGVVSVSAPGMQNWLRVLPNATAMDATLAGIAVDTAGNAHVFTSTRWHAFSPTGTPLFTQSPPASGNITNYFWPSPAIDGAGNLFIHSWSPSYVNAQLLMYRATLTALE